MKSVCSNWRVEVGVCNSVQDCSVVCVCCGVFLWLAAVVLNVLTHVLYCLITILDFFCMC